MMLPVREQLVSQRRDDDCLGMSSSTTLSANSCGLPVCRPIVPCQWIRSDKLCHACRNSKQAANDHYRPFELTQFSYCAHDYYLGHGGISRSESEVLMAIFVHRRG